ncbi:F-box/LRR-repeat protein At1g67190-like [Punica granatum]|nr:F-box/LRR-repeat protein At1g67190-like [Punica granatum]
MTCRKWREAFCKHLRVLSFDSLDWEGYENFTTSQIEILISRIIFQTTGLQSLLIRLYDDYWCSASVVVSWLLYTRTSLRELDYDCSTNPDLNIVDFCRTQKLEKLTLAHALIEHIDPNRHRFTTLRSLSLGYLQISEVDLSLLLTACPELESLELIGLDFSGPPVEVSAPNLSRFYMEFIVLDKLILKASLAEITMHNVGMQHLEFCGLAENLVTINFNNFRIPQAEFYRLISKSLKLRTLRLWDVVFDAGTKAVDLGTIAMCCPQLSLLSLSCDGLDGQLLPYCLLASGRFDNVVCLKVGWSNTLKDEFVDLVERLLGRCPRIMKLTVDGRISGVDYKDCQVLARFNNAIFRTVKKYIHVDVQFEYR